MMTVSRNDLHTDVAKAMSHPLRQRLLILYNEAPASPSDAAERLGEPLGNVAYHTKRLVEHGCLELVEAMRGRGGVKHVYRATVPFELEDDAWIDLPPALRRTLAGRAVTEIGRDVAAGAAAGGFEDDDVHVSRVILRLDDIGRRELAEALRDTIERVDRIADESARRGRDGTESVVAVIHVRTARDVLKRS